VADTLPAERALVGACLLDPATAVRQVVEIVTEADFHNPVLGALFELVCRRYAQGDPIDPVLVDKAAREAGIRNVNAANLHELVSVENTPTASNAAYYAKQVAEHGMRHRLRLAGTRMLQLADTDDDIGIVMGHAREEWTAIAGQAAGRLDAKTLAEVLDGDDEYDWLIPNLLERSDRLVLTGGEGAGKSTFVRQIAVCAAAGVHPTTEQSIDPVRVLVVDAENSEKQWRRAARTLVVQARHMGQLDPAEALRLACVPRLDLTNERDLGAVHRLVDEHEPDLLVIGPLYRLIPRAINSDDDAAPLLTALDGLRARGLALVMEAHAGHASGANGLRDLRPRGSAALMGWPEFGLGLRLQVDDGDPTVRAELVRWRGDRDERAWPNLMRRGGTFPWTDDRHEPQQRSWSPGDAARRTA
jgi:replicative DNA helicase